MTSFAPFISINSLTDTEIVILKSLAGLMIPASELYDVPSADDEAIFQDIVETSKRRGETLARSLATIQEYAVKTENQDFVELSTEMQLSTIHTIKTTDPELLSPIIEVTVQCYYRDDRVMRSLGMPTHSPYPRGYQIVQGDWSLLDTVKNRNSKIWRDT